MKKIKIIYGLEAVGGGALKHLTYLITHLNKSLFDITVVLSGQRNVEAKRNIEKIKDSGVEIYYIDMSREIKIINDCYTIFKIFNILRKGRYDIVHAHSSKAGALLRLAGFINGQKNILYTPHCFYFQGLAGIKRNLFIGLEKLLAKITSSIIVSDGERKEIIENKIIGKKGILNINNAINFDDYIHSSETNETLVKFNIPVGNFTVGAIGRLTPQKDWETFILAANVVLKKYPKTIFIISGEGELRNEVEKLIFSLGLEKNIILTGYVQNINKIFGILDVYVNTSIWEGLPYVILEAMKFKKPVIATDTGNESIIYHERSGFITPVKDYKTIALKICELIEDKQKMIQMGRKGNEILTSKYSFELFIKKHEQHYQRIAFTK